MPPVLPAGAPAAALAQAFVDDINAQNVPDVTAQVDVSSGGGQRFCINTEPDAPVLWVGTSGLPPTLDVNNTGPVTYNPQIEVAPIPSAELSMNNLLTDDEIRWAPVTSEYDVVSGSVNDLRATGSFTPAVGGCAADNTSGNSVIDTFVPPSFEATWYLVRGFSPVDDSGYDGDGPQQDHPRDAEINAAASSCP